MADDDDCGPWREEPPPNDGNEGKAAAAGYDEPKLEAAGNPPLLLKELS
jgi:hypothetical protein